MHFIESTHPNTSENVNGVHFARHENGRMVSVEPVEGDMLDIFLSIPGFQIMGAEEATNDAAQLVAASSAPAVDVSPFAKVFGGTIPAITGTVGDDGVLSMNIPLPDGSVLNLQATSPFDPNPVLLGDTGLAGRLAAQLAAAKAVATTEAVGGDQGAGEGAGATGDTAGAGGDAQQGPAGDAGDAGDAAGADAAAKKAGRKPGATK